MPSLWESSTEYKLLSYEEELKQKREARWFEEHCVSCPICATMVVLPTDDYICSDCRTKMGC